jgi:hypothetical protein
MFLIFQNLLDRLADPKSELEVMAPYYKGFRGKIEWFDDKHKKYYKSGVISEISGTELEISELPSGIWTQTYHQVDISFRKLL